LSLKNDIAAKKVSENFFFGKHPPFFVFVGTSFGFRHRLPASGIAAAKSAVTCRMPLVRWSPARVLAVAE